MTATSIHQPTTSTAEEALTVRPLAPQDIDRLPVADDIRALLRRIVTRTDWSQIGVRAFVAELSPTKESAELVGYALVGLGYPPYFPALSDETKQLYLANLTVFDAFQRCGFATRVLEFFVQEAQRLEIHVMRAECEKGWRVDLYGRVGLQPVPYKGTHEEYPDSHQMLELWLTPEQQNR